MTKRELIERLQALTVPDDTEVEIEVHEHYSLAAVSQYDKYGPPKIVLAPWGKSHG